MEKIRGDKDHTIAYSEKNTREKKGNQVLTETAAQYTTSGSLPQYAEGLETDQIILMENFL